MNIIQQSQGTFLGTNHKSLIQQTLSCSNCRQRVTSIQQIEEESEADGEIINAIERPTQIDRARLMFPENGLENHLEGEENDNGVE